MTEAKGPVVFKDPDKLVDFLIEKVGKEITFGTQLGLGKPNNIMNALYRRAKKDPEVTLKIITALSLEPPTWSSDLERRMLEPIRERLWSGYVELEYAADARRQKLPPNVEVSEFFYKAGAFMNNAQMQQNYISTNYTHAARDVVDFGMNVAGALIGQKVIDGQLKYSMGCNGDTAMDAVDLMRLREKKDKKPTAVVCEINTHLPFMYGDAVSDPSIADAVLDNTEIETRLFAVPREPVVTADFMIGINSSTLLKDDGTLQVGIGSLGDAVAYGLICRHHNNDEYKGIVERSGLLGASKPLIDEWGGTDAFDKGLYGSTEMFVDGFLQLYKNDIMRRRCYDNIHIQRLVSSGAITNGVVTPEAFEALINQDGIHKRLRKKDFDMLVEFGMLKGGLVYEDGVIIDGDKRYPADFYDKANLRAVAENCIGDTLKKGYWIHAGFYVGPEDFYDSVNAMSEEERMMINMTSVLNVNQLYANNKYLNEDLKILHRKNGRFINAGLMVTLNGAVVSDGLENGKVVSGVGGQYNFVSHAHALDDARGILMIRSTRGDGKKAVSNVVFNYGHTTVPRHLRDIIVTEYGIADIRGKSDKEIATRLINVADSRFQEALLTKAKQAGKVPDSYTIPDRFRNNTPERLEQVLAPARAKGLFPAFPFGTSFTPDEIALGKALRTFKAKAEESKLGAMKGVLGSWFKPAPDNARKYLERMQLQNPENAKEKLMQKIVVEALKMTGAV
jgi:acyl-CoA hydrolase